MPVVSKREFRLPNQFGGRQHMKIEFSAKIGCFFIKLPEVMADALNVADVRGSSLADVAKNFEKSIADFETTKTLKTKVLLVWIKTFHKDESREEDREHDDRSITFDYALANEYKFGDNDPAYVLILADGLEGDKLNNWDSDRYAIPYTPDAERSLAKIKKRFDNYAGMLHKLLGPLPDNSKKEGSELTSALIKKSLTSAATAVIE